MSEWIKATKESVDALIDSCSGRGGKENEASINFMPAEMDEGYFTVSGTHGAYIAQCVRKCPSAVVEYKIGRVRKDKRDGSVEYDDVSWTVKFDALAARSMSSVLVTEDRYIVRKSKGE